ncbi:hypothetical protein H8L32_05190 [Undibacterium sp. CY18W]|uniref:Bacteriocin-type signal sequence-containing protein n=1 Tax=Undibacterium hunanense TaxID=2762292 RepID=A0ABR6ZLS0_9BURK|nr:hypothetical protein [Undibacterium hunanense]MBC3916863.1 hypothetical protein [Undibacterium hunanense]
MKDLIASNITVSLNNDSEAHNEQDMHTLTNEEILAVAGGPEVDIETGNGG